MSSDGKFNILLGKLFQYLTTPANEIFLIYKKVLELVFKIYIKAEKSVEFFHNWGV